MRKLLRQTSGQALVENALMMGFIALLGLVVLTELLQAIMAALASLDPSALNNIAGYGEAYGAPFAPPSPAVAGHPFSPHP